MTVAEGFCAQRVDAREIMDDPIESLTELEASMRDVEFQNAWFGGAAPALRELDRIGAKSVLDVGTGSADIPLLLARRADRRRAELTITCLDRSDQMLEIARKRTGEHTRLRFVQADGAALPFDDGAFDVAMCNLALHHFDPGSAALMLRELRRVSRRSPLVCDLRRSVTAFACAYAFSRVFTRNRVTRNDAPLSVRRAYTPSEALALAAQAGWREPHVRSYPFFRMALVDG